MGDGEIPPLSEVPEYTPTSLSSPISQYCFTLQAHRGENRIVSGTGVAIAPYLVLTAGHVIEDFARQLLDMTLEGSTRVAFESRHSLLAAHIRHDLNLASVWNVTKYWVARFTDLALLRLTPRTTEQPEYVWRCPQLNMIPPPIGARVASFGYTKSHSRRDEAGKITWYAEGITSTGFVQEHHWERRDNAMLPFPCYRTNTRIDGGMSGGPAFNNDGELVGACSSAMSEPAENGQYTAYVAALWPLMGMKIDYLTEGEFLPLLELARREIIHTSNLDRVTIDEHGIVTVTV
ncbi:MAG: serine protease [Methylacidiphilales bacterium]|nr:serine protease [Candidatus Methylacidiphilales bacterium]